MRNIFAIFIFLGTSVPTFAGGVHCRDCVEDGKCVPLPTCTGARLAAAIRMCDKSGAFVCVGPGAACKPYEPVHPCGDKEGDETGQPLAELFSRT